MNEAKKQVPQTDVKSKIDGEPSLDTGNSPALSKFKRELEALAIIQSIVRNEVCADRIKPYFIEDNDHLAIVIDHKYKPLCRVWLNDKNEMSFSLYKKRETTLIKTLGELYEHSEGILEAARNHLNRKQIAEEA